MATYTFIALVVGFFALAFGFGFIAGVAHERDKYRVSGSIEVIAVDSEYLESLLAGPTPELVMWLNGGFESEAEHVDITVAIWSVRVVEETLMQDDIYFESTFHGPTNKHRIKLPKESLALLDSIGVKYELITEKE